MKTSRHPNEMESRAAEALGNLLHQVSSIKTHDIRFQPAHRNSDIVASINVLGRSHRLVCNVTGSEPAEVRKALHKLRICADRKKADSTPVLITSYLSMETRHMCEKSRVGFLDLAGNARLEVDEVFIGRRSARSMPAMHSGERISA